MFRQLTYLHRKRLAALLSEGTSKASIARILGVDRSTIYRELQRNTRPGKAYCPTFAQAWSDLRKREHPHVGKRSETFHRKRRKRSRVLFRGLRLYQKRLRIKKRKQTIGRKKQVRPYLGKDKLRGNFPKSSLCKRNGVKGRATKQKKMIPPLRIIRLVASCKEQAAKQSAGSEHQLVQKGNTGVRHCNTFFPPSHRTRIAPYTFTGKAQVVVPSALFKNALLYIAPVTLTGTPAVATAVGFSKGLPPERHIKARCFDRVTLTGSR